MDASEIAEVINAVFPSKKDFSSTLATLAKTAELRKIEIAIEGLNAKRTEVLAPIENERIELDNQRRSIIEELRPDSAK